MVIQHSDLRALERRAFSRFYEDGLFDLLLGLLLVIMAVSAVVQDWSGSEPATMAFMAVASIVAVVGFMVVRERRVRPRLGEFKPAPARQRRITLTRLVLLASCMLGLAAFGAGSVMHGSGVPPASVEVILPVVFFVNATLVLAIMAYLLDVPRFALYGVLLGLVGPLMIWPSVVWDLRMPPALAFAIPALPILVIGVWKLVRFVRTYPVIHDPAEDDCLGA